MGTPRALHSATTLPDGRVLVAGGMTGTIDTSPVSSAELYDPAADRWTPTGSMTVTAGSHDAVLMADGRVLAVSAVPAGAGTSETYDPATGRWTQAGSLPAGVAAGAVAPLPDGRVLAAGGRLWDPETGSQGPVPTAALFDPATATWRPTASLPTGEEGPATALADGRVLLVGTTPEWPTPDRQGHTHLFDPALERWTDLGPTPPLETDASLTLLPDGRVFVTDDGGQETDTPRSYTWSPSDGWSPTGAREAVTELHTYARHDEAVLADGKVLALTGEFDKNEVIVDLYDPSSDTWQRLPSIEEQFSVPVLAPAAAGTRAVLTGKGWGAADDTHAEAYTFEPIPPPAISETFTDGAGGLTPVLGGTWAAADGGYVLSAPAGTGAGSGNSNLAVHGTEIAGDFTLTVGAAVTPTPEAWNDVSIVFGYRSPRDHYYVSFNESDNAATSGIFRVVNGKVKALANIPTRIRAGTTYDVRVERRGAGIAVFLGATRVATATDRTFLAGKVGFGSRNDGATFDDLIVTAGAPVPVVAETFSARPSGVTPVSGGRWAVTGGALALTSPASAPGPGNSNVAVHGTTVWRDFFLTVRGTTKATAEAWNDFSVLFGYQDPANHYYASFNESNNAGTSGLFRVVDGVVVELADITTRIKAGTATTVGVRRSGDEIVVHLGPDVVARATDATFASGAVGVGTRNDAATFDDLAVVER